MNEPVSMTITQLRAALASGELSAESLATATLEALEERSELNAFISQTPAPSLLEQARAVDRAREAGEELGPLAGIPIALKDNLCQRGTRTTAGSKMLADFVAPYDATVVRKLRRAGALFVGKTNLDEFAMGSSSETSAFGPVRHPLDPELVPGGSSGGSAAAVAANLCAAALGSDTGGSIRQPASHCGVVGLKPTYGRISRYGLVAFASSLDQIGPITRSVEDAALMLEILAGHDPMDMTSSEQSVDSYLQAVERGVEGLRVGVVQECLQEEGLDAEVSERLQESIARLEAAGASIVDVSLPHAEYAVATYYLIATAEASSNLARYDGVRYGHRVEDPEDLSELYERSRSEGFGAEVKRRILLGTFVLSAGFYDAYYLRAQKVRTLIRSDFGRAFEEADVLLTPTAPTPAFRLGEKLEDPLQMYLADLFTLSCNLAGLPGISVPAGTTEEGLPVGVQLMAPAFQEGTLLCAARHAQAPVSE